VDDTDVVLGAGHCIRASFACAITVVCVCVCVCVCVRVCVCVLWTGYVKNTLLRNPTTQSPRDARHTHTHDNIQSETLRDKPNTRQHLSHTQQNTQNKLTTTTSTTKQHATQTPTTTTPRNKNNTTKARCYTTTKSTHLNNDMIQLRQTTITT
jgi:hypothetical protein